MAKVKSAKNKTIDFTEKEGKQYIDRCILEKDIAGLDSIINKTIIGNSFTAIKRIPDKCVDLIIVDPPYNLAKNYHGNKFNKMGMMNITNTQCNGLHNVKESLKILEVYMYAVIEKVL